MTLQAVQKTAALLTNAQGFRSSGASATRIQMA